MKVGDQIIYIPNHIKIEGAFEKNPDVEFGFITSFSSDGDAFCRYWSKFEEDLRTKANSELTPIKNIYPFLSHTQEEIEMVCQKYNIMM